MSLFSRRLRSGALLAAAGPVHVVPSGSVTEVPEALAGPPPSRCRHDAAPNLTGHVYRRGDRLFLSYAINLHCRTCGDTISGFASIVPLAPGPGRSEWAEARHVDVLGHIPDGLANWTRR